MSNKFNLPEAAQAVYDKIHDTWKFENGKATFDKDAFKKSLPDGLTYETVKQVNNHAQNFALAVAAINGEKAIETLKENKGIDKVIATAEMYHGKVVHTVHRTATVRNVATGAESEVLGQSNTKIIITGNGKDFKEVKARIAELAAKAL
nr:MAG TPA: hypothetical protein [Caudoviricetes sp.]